MKIIEFTLTQTYKPNGEESCTFCFVIIPPTLILALFLNLTYESRWTNLTLWTELNLPFASTKIDSLKNCKRFEQKKSRRKGRSNTVEELLGENFLIEVLSENPIHNVRHYYSTVDFIATIAPMRCLPPPTRTESHPFWKTSVIPPVALLRDAGSSILRHVSWIFP